MSGVYDGKPYTQTQFNAMTSEEKRRMGNVQCEKRQTGERKFKHLLGGIGFPGAIKTVQYYKHDGHATDITGKKKLYAYVKTQSLRTWMEQTAYSNANTDLSRSRKPGHVISPPATDFLQVYKEDNSEEIHKPTGIDVSFGNSM